MSIGRRRFIASTSAMGAAMIARRAHAANLGKVTAWAVRDPQNSTQVSLASRLGYFAAEGLEVDLRWVTSFSDLYAPAGAGQVDFTVTSVNNGLRWHQDNIPMSYIALMTDIAGGQGVAIDPAAVKSPADFPNVKIGMASGSTVELALRNFARAYNLDFSKFQFINLQPPDQLSAFSSKQIQVLAFWQPWLHRAVNEFSARMYFSGRKSYIDGAPKDVDWLTLPSGVLANKRLIDEKPEVVRAFLSALLKAQKFVNEQPQRAAAELARDMRVTPAVMEALLPTNVYSATLDQSVLTGIDKIQDFLIASRRLRARVDSLSIINTTFLRALAPETVRVGAR
ncbi:MAG: ABC transporter substrate-binding protein [Alphaproteobacteria bacterium]|nr:ABC transporter substrate-binding protein [Alphaproteobacteria bacterium]